MPKILPIALVQTSDEQNLPFVVVQPTHIQLLQVYHQMQFGHYIPISKSGRHSVNECNNILKRPERSNRTLSLCESVSLRVCVHEHIISNYCSKDNVESDPFC